MQYDFGPNTVFALWYQLMLHSYCSYYVCVCCGCFVVCVYCNRILLFSSSTTSCFRRNSLVKVLQRIFDVVIWQSAYSFVNSWFVHNTFMSSYIHIQYLHKCISDSLTPTWKQQWSVWCRSHLSENRSSAANKNGKASSTVWWRARWKWWRTKQVCSYSYAAYMRVQRSHRMSNVALHS